MANNRPPRRRAHLRIYPDAICGTCAAAFRPRSSNANRYCSRACMPSKPHRHTTGTISRVRALTEAGLSAAAVAREMGDAISRHAVCGIRRRNKLTPDRGQIYQTWTAELRGAAQAADWPQFDALLLRMMPQAIGRRAA